jgi:hypothetical protein
LPIFPIALSKSLADTRIGCVFFLALEKIFGANCKGYLRTLPKRLRIKNLYIRYSSFLRADFSNFRRGSRTWEPHFRHCIRTSMPIYMISKSFPPQGSLFYF